ncbi:MAG: hypothetical protein AAFR58_17860 [Cyanobacteria bacterium J06627_28]
MLFNLTKTYEWELRLSDKIAPDFAIDDYNTLRQQFESKYPDTVKELT